VKKKSAFDGIGAASFSIGLFAYWIVTVVVPLEAV
jgi:hypothetical protein